MDAESLIEEVMEGDPISFVQAANAVLDTAGNIASADFMVENNFPSLNALIDKKGKSPSSSYPKPLRALRSKTTRRKR